MRISIDQMNDGKRAALMMSALSKAKSLWVKEATMLIGPAVQEANAAQCPVCCPIS